MKLGNAQEITRKSGKSHQEFPMNFPGNSHEMHRKLPGNVMKFQGNSHEITRKFPGNAHESTMKFPMKVPANDPPW
jgi:hypothetical protein